MVESIEGTATMHLTHGDARLADDLDGPASATAHDEHGPAHEHQTGEHDGHGHGHGHGDHAAAFRDRFWWSLALAVPVVVFSPMFADLLGYRPFAGTGWISPVLGTVVYCYGGWPFLTGAVAELRSRQPGMMLLVGLAITVAFVASLATSLDLTGLDLDFWWELALLVVIMLLGHWLEMRALGRASSALDALAALLPDRADRVEADGTIRPVELAELAAGDEVLVRPGGRVPADGIVTAGRAAFDESMITGESRPVGRGPGERVIAGSVATDSGVRIRLEAVGEDTALAGVRRLVDQAQSSRSRAQALADRAAAALFYVAAVAGLGTFAGWLAVGAPADAVERTVTVLVIACPHALGLAIPLVVAISTALAARSGILVKDRLALERMRTIDTVLFDKTGTLTRGRPTVIGVITAAAAQAPAALGTADAPTTRARDADGGAASTGAMAIGDAAAGVPARTLVDDQAERDRLLRLAAAVETDSEHPLARAIVAAADALPRLDDPRPAVRDFTSLPGRGVRAVVDGRTVALGGPALLRDHAPAGTLGHPAAGTGAGTGAGHGHGHGLADVAGTLEIADGIRAAAAAWSARGATVLYVVADGAVLGAIALADELRPTARAAVDALHRRGIRVVMVTGDARPVADAVAAELGIDEVFAEVLPADKDAKVTELTARGRRVAVVGDGVNDAPALARADVGIAIGAGTDVAVASAGVVLASDDPLGVLAVIRLSEASYRTMTQNLAWAAGYNAAAIPLAAGILAPIGFVLPPAVGAILMSVSTIVVAANAQLLRRLRLRPDQDAATTAPGASPVDQSATGPGAVLDERSERVASS
jgi:Cu2+-exporting ATPase